ncbi:hypothetical protein HJG60_011889 [Phyllostomus discolor]|uniref:Uncharacterized protein n=1 Tax=Phyllostomus discolor TaxID=89673 RepID=A0A833ZD39_9CHIR|nr:hypothetical protein HJG60_011889 [Phyllostomus discolor]
MLSDVSPWTPAQCFPFHKPLCSGPPLPLGYPFACQIWQKAQHKCHFFHEVLSTVSFPLPSFPETCLCLEHHSSISEFIPAFSYFTASLVCWLFLCVAHHFSQLADSCDVPSWYQSFALRSPQ